MIARGPLRLTRFRRCLCWVAAVFAGLVAQTAISHEFNPAVLTISESQSSLVDVTWKRPLRADARVEVVMPATCVARDHITSQVLGAMIIDRWSADCETRLAGNSVGVQFLRQDPLDILLQVQNSAGQTWSTILTSLKPRVDVPAEWRADNNFGAYALLGIEHILLGWDHLLFVLCLLLLVKSPKSLLLTITGFTLGHSCTLGFAALGWLRVPATPVEVCIALSVVLLAREVIVKDSHSLTRRYPGWIATGFGLLHGLGFGNALLEIGLPQHGLIQTLLAFNLGVELGQLAVICLALVVVRMAGKLSPLRAPGIRPEWLAYPAGVIAMAWVIERSSGLTATLF